MDKPGTWYNLHALSSHSNNAAESEIPNVIRDLTQTPPSVQRRTIDTYFTPNASFTHPFCRTGSFYWSQTLNSRNLIHAIYRWYKIMSPRIDLTIQSIGTNQSSRVYYTRLLTKQAFDKSSLILYVMISQRFRIWIVPFYVAPVNLVTVLQLVHDKESDKYYISSQDDLYQVNQFVRFIWLGGWLVLWLCQITATFFCLIGAILLWPQTWVEEHWLRDGWTGIAG